MLEKIELFLPIVTANGVRILREDLLGRRWDWPLDGGLRFRDGGVCWDARRRCAVWSAR